MIIFFLCIDFRTLEAKLPAHLPKDAGASEVPLDPVEQLELRIVCTARGVPVPRSAGRPLIDPGTGRINPFALVGHRVRFDVGAIRCGDVAALGRALARIAGDPSRRVRDDAHPGRMKLVPVVVAPGSGTVYQDVVQAIDAVIAAGFEDVRFGGRAR